MLTISLSPPCQISVYKSEMKIAHTLIFVLQVSVSTQILHEVFLLLQVVIPVFNVFLIFFRKDETLYTYTHIYANIDPVSHQQHLRMILMIIQNQNDSE